MSLAQLMAVFDPERQGESKMRRTYNVERITVMAGFLLPAVLRNTYPILHKPEVS